MLPLEPQPTDAGTGHVPHTVAAAFGEIVWLMSQSPLHKALAIGDLEWLVMPAILNRQFRMFHHEGRPAAVVLFGFLSPEAEARIEAGATGMAPEDWHSGDQAWILQVIAPFGGGEAFAKDTCSTVLTGRPVKMQVMGKTQTLRG